ncbi:MAG: DNRLRE domain-containing protein, partial [Planctomycetota bacterium]
MLRKYLVLSVALCALVFVCTPFSSVLADPDNDHGNSSSPAATLTRYATHYDLGGGQHRALITIAAQNYQRNDGQWAPIRLSLEPAVSSSGFDFECLENGLVSRFGTHDGRPSVAANAQGASPIMMTASALVARDAAGNMLRSTAPGAVTPALVSASTVHYAGLFPGATDEYVAAPDKMKHTLLLDSTALQLPAGTAWIGGVYELVLPVGHELQLADGTPVAGPMIVDGAMRVAVDGLPLYRIERVVISDSSMSPAGITDGRYSIVPLGDNCFRMTMEAPAAWCADPSRMLPIRIDPTLALEPDAAAGKDAPVWAGSAGTNYGTSQWTWAGFVGANSEINSLIQFDLTSIPTFAQVTSASFDWSNTAQANLDGINVDCHVITAAWVEATVNWNTRPAHNVNLFDTKVFSGGYGWETWTNMAATVQNWVSGAVVNNGFTFKAPNAGAVYAAGGTSDAAAGTWPKFTVDYNLGPVIQTPAAGALPDGYVSTAYTQAYTISGGVAPITWSIIAGSLPAGLNINPTTGTISGTPSTPGNSSFTVEVRDTNNQTDTHAQTINVYSALAITNPPVGARADGI